MHPYLVSMTIRFTLPVKAPDRSAAISKAKDMIRGALAAIGLAMDDERVDAYASRDYREER